MPQILIVVGAVLVLLGLAGVTAGAPDWLLGLALGATMIQSGAIAFVGGLVLIALGLVLKTMQELLDRLRSLPAQPPARPAAAPREMLVAHPPQSAPVARGPRPAPVQETPHAPAERAPEQAPDGTVPLRRERISSDLGEEPIRPRRERAADAEPGPAQRSRREGNRAFPSDEQMRVRRERPAEDESEDPSLRRDPETPPAFEEIARLRESASNPRREEPSRLRRELPPPPPPPPLPMVPDERRRPRATNESALQMPRFRPVETPPAQERAAPDTKVVRSGVIGGMAYTLYADGSIEAELPIGTVRFGSISELQDHVMRTGTEADAGFTESSR